MLVSFVDFSFFILVKSVPESPSTRLFKAGKLTETLHDLTDIPLFPVNHVGIIAYSMLISLSTQSETQTAGERALVGFAFMFGALSTDLCVCSCATGVCELQLLWEVYLIQLLGDASPGPRLQPVRCQRLTH